MEIIRVLDIKIFYFINQVLNNYYFDYFMNSFTKLGSGIFVFGAGLICLFFKEKKIKLLGVFILIGTLISFGAVSFLKPAFKILRPFIALRDVNYIIASDGYSFPSGHSCFAFMLATILSAKNKKRKALYLIAIIVAISRIYLGLHYPSDVVAGAALGVIIGFVMVKLYSYFTLQEKVPS